MSALNAFAREDGAWLIADTAGYDHFGRVLDVNGKVHACAPLRLLVGHSGSFSTDAPEVIEAWLADQRCQSGALAGLPALLRELASHFAEAMGNGAAQTAGPLPDVSRLIIALWDMHDNRAKAAIISSIADLGETPPFTLRPLKTIFSPPLTVDRWPGHSFDPATDAAELAALQRLETDERGIHRVGGAFEAWRVHAGGIERRIVHEWADVVGEPLRIN